MNRENDFIISRLKHFISYLWLDNVTFAMHCNLMVARRRATRFELFWPNLYCGYSQSTGIPAGRVGPDLTRGYTRTRNIPVRDAVTLTLHVCSRLSVISSNSVPNLSEIERSTANLITIDLAYFHPFSRVATDTRFQYRGSDLPQIWKEDRPSFALQMRIRCFISKLHSFKGQISKYLTPCKS